jgi:hypothetical protein
VAVFWTVDAVELSAHGDVLRVRWGLIDTKQTPGSMADRMLLKSPTWWP